MQAIQTEYKGYRFRSRLEARWAVAFDAMGIKWEYEPEGYEGETIRYLPDFRLLNVRHRSYVDEFEPVWVEVKGVMTEKDLRKIEAFIGYGEYGPSCNPLLVIGSLPNNEEIGVWDGNEICWSYRYMDGDEYPAYFSKHKGDIWIAGPDHDEYDGGELMKKGIEAAKKARFEHGEFGIGL